MNVLSLFDGMSCGQIALRKMGIKVDNYYASEIDKYAITVAKNNFPDMKHIGDVTALRAEDLPKIDLLMGGSPCQGFSFAGKQLNFDDPRSALFFQFVRLLRDCKPKYFLLENVRMKKEYQQVISEHLGVEPVKINSALVSAQNRVRLYWTNIPGVYITQPEDKGIVLKDILEDDATEPMLSNIYGGFKEKKPRIHTGKSVTIRTASGGGHIPSVTLKPITQPEDKGIVLKGILEDDVSDEFNSGVQKAGGKYNNMLNTNYKSQANTIHKTNKKSATICAGTHGYALGHIEIQEDGSLVVPEATKKGYTVIQPGDCFDATFIKSKTRRGRNMKDKSNCLTAANYDYMVLDGPYPMQFKAKNKKNVIINESDLDAPKTVYEARTELGKQTRREIKRLTGKDSTKRSPEHKQYQVQKHQKANCLVTVDSELNKVIDKQLVYRKLTPLECERLQTVPDGYTEGVSNTQRYKMLGNGWTVDVICHIFQALKAQQVRQVA